MSKKLMSFASRKVAAFLAGLVVGTADEKTTNVVTFTAKVPA